MFLVVAEERARLGVRERRKRERELFLKKINKLVRGNVQIYGRGLGDNGGVVCGLHVAHKTSHKISPN